MKATVVDKNSTEARMYQTFCNDFGLKPEWLGKEFVYKGETYTIIGLNPRKKKFPVLTEGNGDVSFSAGFTIAVLTNTVDAYNKKRDDDFNNKTAKMLKDARKKFLSDAEFYDVPKTWLDKTISFKRKLYTIIGIKGNTRYPIVTKSCSDGRTMFFTVDCVKEALAAAKKAA